MAFLRDRTTLKLFLKGAVAMIGGLIVIHLVASMFPLVVYPPSRLGALIRDNTPGGLATKAIEQGVRLSRASGLKFLEHAALQGLSILVQAAFVAIAGAAAVYSEKGLLPSQKAWRALGFALMFFAGACLLAATSESGLPIVSIASYAAAAYLVARLVSPVSLASVLEPKITGAETPLDAIRRSRRRFLKRSAGAVGGVAIAGVVAKNLIGGSFKPAPIASADTRFKPPPGDPNFPSLQGLTPEITANNDFYNVDIDITKPSVNPNTWRLKVGGLVEKPFELDYRHLQSEFNVVEMASTLSCISNDVGGDLVSTAVWRGVVLKDVLQRAGVRPGAVDLIFRGADGYSDSITLEKGLQEDTLLAFGMNGVALPKENGFPARIIVPGIFGMKNVKWLTAIEVTDYDYQGYWQKRGWSDEAFVKTQARIDTPGGNATTSSPATVAGVAWAGDRGINAVEVSYDKGKTWLPTTLKRPLSPNSWRLWATEVTGKGDKEVRVRATDGTGTPQESHRTYSHPDGASGQHSTTFTLR